MEDSTDQSESQERIRDYLTQITIGCGDSTCNNRHCASSVNFIHRGIDNNRAADLARVLLQTSAPLCCNVAGQKAYEPMQSSNYASMTLSAPIAIPSCSSNPEGMDLEVESLETGNLEEIEGPTLDSVHNDISPSLSRFLLQISNSPPSITNLMPIPESSTSVGTADVGDNTESIRLNHLFGLLDRFVKQTNRKPTTEPEGNLAGPACLLDKRVSGLSLDEVRSCVEHCEKQQFWTPLKILIEEVFTSPTALANSFPVKDSGISVDVEMNPPVSAFGAVLASTSAAKPNPKISVMSSPFLNKPTDQALSLDIEQAREAYELLFKRPPQSLEIGSTLSHLLRRQLIVTLRKIFRIYPFSASASTSTGTSDDTCLSLLSEVNPSVGGEADRMQRRMTNLFAVIYACPLVTDPLHFEPILPHLCHMTVSLPMATQARLCRAWADHACKQRTLCPTASFWLLDLHRILMQQITLHCLALEPLVGNTSSDAKEGPAPNDDSVICDSARVIRIVFYASLLGGGCDSPDLLELEARENAAVEAMGRPVSSSLFRFERTKVPKDPLGTILGISPTDTRNPIIPAKEFLNETLNEILVVEKDFANFRSRLSGFLEKFSFMELPFMLQTTTKITQLYYHNRLNMLQERRGAILDALFSTSASASAAALEMPYFKICVARERVVEDALLVLEFTREESVGDFKKQIYVEFDGEQGVDEGGLSKEFFQLIIEHIFNPDYGMFTFDEDSQCFWFNRSPLAEELHREYSLIGTVLGLAIYNNIILDIRFPAVMYRKLCGKLASGLEDLRDAWPDLARGLQALLDYDGDNFEDDHCLYFVASYRDMFGQTVTTDLIPNGSSIPVTLENRHEYVARTINFLLNSSVKTQFEAFRKGFVLVVGGTPLFMLFSPSEIELLLRGSQDYDFNELERVTEYEGDYNAESPVICNFWSVVHSMSDNEQRKLLQFATGSDRVPIGGMSRLKFVITRQGPDSDRLPSAHTCFNVLLLPEYSSREKLERCLRIAITYSKGFGMF